MRRLTAQLLGLAAIARGVFWKKPAQDAAAVPDYVLTEEHHHVLPHLLALVAREAAAEENAEELVARRVRRAELDDAVRSERHPRAAEGEGNVKHRRRVRYSLGRG